jgi:hypothetical protein
VRFIQVVELESKLANPIGKEGEYDEPHDHYFNEASQRKK